MQYHQKDKQPTQTSAKQVQNMDNLTESEYSEVVYMEPYHHMNMSPDANRSPNMSRSPLMRSGNIVSSVKKVLQERPDTATLLGERPINSLVMTINQRRGDVRYERSPKTINIGDTKEQIKYNIRTLNARKSPKPRDYETYTSIQGEFDPNAQFRSFIREDQLQVTDSNIINANRSPVPINRANREVLVMGSNVQKMSPYNNYDGVNSSGEKMAEQQMNELKNVIGMHKPVVQDNIAANRYTQINLTEHTQQNAMNADDNVNMQSTQNNLSVAEKYNKQSYNNMTQSDIKKIIRKFTRVYDPIKNNNGILIEERQVTLPGANDEVFNGRYRVLRKMNKLSTFLMGKRSPRSPDKSDEELNCSGSCDKDKRTFNVQTLNKSGQKRMTKKSPDKKFLYVSLAMMSSKGPNAEDRTILRKMRLDKGGVVDLAQDEYKKSTYKIKKMKVTRNTGRGLIKTNPKYREKAAKIIQGWWRELKELYQGNMKKIIKIQSIWRGKFVRKYIYDMLYLNFLYVSFCTNIQRVLTNHVRPRIFRLLRTGEFSEEECDEFSRTPLSKQQQRKLERDFYLKKMFNTIEQRKRRIASTFWRQWLYALKEKDSLATKYSKLVQIRANQEGMKHVLRRYFDRWAFNAKILRMREEVSATKNQLERSTEIITTYKRITNIADDVIQPQYYYETAQSGERIVSYETNEERLNQIKNDLNKRNTDKIVGLNLLIEGLNKLKNHKLNEKTKDKVKNYLENIERIMSMRNLVKLGVNQKRNILRNMVYKWFRKVSDRKIQQQIISSKAEFERKADNRLSELKLSIFKKIIENIQNKANKNILRKYFNRYFRKSVQLAFKQQNKEKKENEERILNQRSEIQNLTIKISNLNDSINMSKVKREIEDKEKEKVYIKKAQALDESKVRACWLLQKFTWRKTHKYPLGAFAEKLGQLSLKKTLMTVLKYYSKSTKNIVRNKLSQWRRKVEKLTIKERFNRLFAKLVLILHNNHKRKIMQKYFSQWKHKTKSSGLKNKSITIAKGFFDAGDAMRLKARKMYFAQFIKRLRKTVNPKYITQNTKIIYKYYDKNAKNSVKKALDKWRNNVRDQKLRELRTKLFYNLYGKYNDTTSKLNKYFYKWRYQSITEKLIETTLIETTESVYEKTTKIQSIVSTSLINRLERKKNMDKMRDAFRHWRTVLQNDKSRVKQIPRLFNLYNIKQNGSRLLLNMDSVAMPKRRREILLKILNKRHKFDRFNLNKYLLKWNNKVQAIKSATSHRPYLKTIMEILFTKNDKENLSKAFNHWRFQGRRLPAKNPFEIAIRKIKKIFVKKPFQLYKYRMKLTDTKTLQPKGAAFISHINTAALRKPMKNFIQNLRRNIFLQKMSTILPNVFDKYRNEVTKTYLKKWFTNTVEDRKNKELKLAQWIKTKFLEKKRRDADRREALLVKIINRKAKDNINTMRVPFKYWKRLTTTDISDDNAKIIQEFCRRCLLTIKKNKFDAGQRLGEVLKALVKLMVAKYLRDLNDNLPDKVKQAVKTMLEIHKRYTVRKILVDEEIKEILYRIINKKTDVDRYAVLRHFFSKWKNDGDIIKEKANIIKRAWRDYLIRKQQDKAQRLRNLLIKIIHKHESTDHQRAQFGFRRWQKKVQEHKCYDYATIIQDFCHIKIEEIAKLKLRRFLEHLADKYPKSKISTLAKFHKLLTALKKHPQKAFLQNLRDSIRYRIISILLLKILRQTSSTLDDQRIKHYFSTWKIKSDLINKKETYCATKIQTAFRAYLVQKELDRARRLKQILTVIVKRCDLNQKPMIFYRWLKNTRLAKCQEDATIIQDFCKQKLNEIKIQKQEQKMRNYLALSEVLVRVRGDLRGPFEAIRQKSRESGIKKFAEFLSRKRKEKLKDSFDNIRNYHTILRVVILERLTEKLRTSTLRNYLRKYRDNTIKDKVIQQRLTTFYNRLDKNNKNILGSNLMKWRLKAKQLKQRDYADIIVDFCKGLCQQRKSQTNWTKLYDLARSRLVKSDLTQLLRTIKTYKTLTRMTTTITRKMRTSAINNIKNNNDNINLLQKLRIVFFKMDDVNNHSKLLYYLYLWKHKKDILNERDLALHRMMQDLELRRKKIAAYYINSAFLVKKLYHDLPLIRLKDAFNKIKKYGNERQKYTNLSANMLKDKAHIRVSTNRVFLQKLYKLFAYRVLDNLFKRLEAARREKALPAFANIYAYLRSKYVEKSEFSYTNSKGSMNNTIQPQHLIKLSFKTAPKQPSAKQPKKEELYAVVCSHLGRWLNSRRKSTLRSCFERIRDKARAIKFCQLYKTYSNSRILNRKKELIDDLREGLHNLNARKAALQKMLFMVKKIFLKKTVTTLIESSRMHYIMYLVNMAMMEKKIMEQRFLRQIIRKWRFTTFVKNMAKRKLELMYKNMHLSFLEMSNDIFGDDNSLNPSVLKEFERFGDGVGMWANEDPNLMKEAGLCRGFKRKYFFEPVTVPSTVTKKVTVEEERTEERYLEEIPEEYMMNEGTFESYEKKEKRKGKNVGGYKSKKVEEDIKKE